VQYIINQNYDIFYIKIVTYGVCVILLLRDRMLVSMYLFLYYVSTKT
jgi:hypothetical protein